ncbi:hypothetical protein TNCV_2290061 [Trichonephila clavipes]|uniref:Uncharacterized protein n=1 Tax=Trichonephila clavipes TaxID=2585209 RepID=A0A8X6RIW4_TRICX|nr:hypothetical protein TNCV_2290061 [Trichonephila clavipes]
MSTFKDDRQINLKVDSDDVQDLLDFRNQELTIDVLVEMHENEQDIEELKSLNPVQPEDRITVGNLTGFGKVSKTEFPKSTVGRRLSERLLSVASNIRTRVFLERKTEGVLWYSGTYFKLCRKSASPLMRLVKALHHPLQIGGRAKSYSHLYAASSQGRLLGPSPGFQSRYRPSTRPEQHHDPNNFHHLFSKTLEFRTKGCFFRGIEL